MTKRILNLIILVTLLFSFTGTAFAQDYFFHLETSIVHVLLNSDGTVSLDYTLVFNNDPSGHAIEYVDVGLPNYSYDSSSIQADVDGQSVSVSSSDYEGDDSGVAVVLGSRSIQPGQKGTVHVWVGSIDRMFFIEDTDEAYASVNFSPFWFGSQYVKGETDMTVIFHLPPGVQPEEPRWHKSPSGFPEEPATGHDGDGRVTYTWHNPNATADKKYVFGASFPASYIPVEVVAAPTISDRTGINEDDLIGFLCCGGFGTFIILIGWLGVVSERKRKLKYLPPKIRIEGHGIKRGLTAVEAAILMEKPVDKVLTMILFSVIKKDAATVVTSDPLKLKVDDPLPEGLHSYESEFLEAFKITKARDRQTRLQTLMVELIKSVGKKMKGFSHKESVAYYQKIMERAWQQVEAADTPEVKSQKFDEHMGWTMLDKDFNTRTQDTFRTGPVYVPIWWHRYDPGWSSRSTTSTPKISTSLPSSGGGGRPTPSVPVLPGGEFAATVVTGVQNFSDKVVGNVSDFTSKITNKTNPVPKSSSSSGWKSSGGGGSSCACACACAGCACACAGGGR